MLVERERSIGFNNTNDKYMIGDKGCMNQLRIGICDDERIILEQLEWIIRKVWKDKKTEARLYLFDTGEELISNIQELDVVFLDIEMPVIDGFTIGKKILEINSECKIIMASGQNNRFKEAFQIHAIRFITKPFDRKEVEEALEAVRNLDIGGEIIELHENRVTVPIKQKIIQYVIAYDSYTTFILKNRILRKDISLNVLEEEMDERIFFRIDRKTIVNMLHIRRYDKGKITMDEKEFLVSRRKKKEFEKAYIECDLKYR